MFGMGGYGPIIGSGGKGHKSGPYGFGGFGKGKSKGKSKGPKEEKPTVNPNQINPAKEPFDGGISFKNIFQEKLSKQIHRPISPGDLVYTCSRVKGGRMCTMTLPCMGPDHPSYESDMPAKDEKAAGQMAAAKALMSLFPEVYEAVVQAHSGGIVGESADIDPMGEPKGLLNRHVQLAAGRPMASGDIVYDSKWRNDLNSYFCVVKLNALDGGTGTHVYESDAAPGGFKEAKQAEKSAARNALAANAELFESAVAAHDAKKAIDAQISQAKGAKFKGGGKGFGKTFGKGAGKCDVKGMPYSMAMMPGRLG